MLGSGVQKLNNKNESLSKSIKGEFSFPSLNSSSQNNEILESCPAFIEELAEVKSLWSASNARFRAILGQSDFKAWIAPLVLEKVSNEAIYLCAPSEFARTRVRTEYLHRLQGVWNDCDAKKRRLIITAEGQKPAANKVSQQAQINNERPSFSKTQSAIILGGDFTAKGKTFEEFEVGSSNQVAFAVAKQIASDNGNSELIFLHGINGIGKTHLLTGIFTHCANVSPNRKVISLSAQRFLNLFQSALRDKEMGAFKEIFKDIDLLLIDDIQLICGKAATMEEFSQIIMDLLGRGKSVAVTADVPPEALIGIDNRTKGVLSSGFNVRIHEPDFELRRKIAARKVKEFAQNSPNFKLSGEALNLVAARITGTGRNIEGAIKQIYATSALIEREATMEVILGAIGERFSAPQKSVPVETIKKRVAAHFDISMDDLMGTRRHTSVARPRQIAMYFCKKFTKRSFPDIAARMGGRDHTTVIHAVKRIEELASKDARFAAELQILANKILA